MEFQVRGGRRYKKMFTRYLMIASAILLVSACKDNNKGQVNTTDGSQQSSMIDDGSAQRAEPGTERDFVENVGDRVFFGYDSYELSPEARATLEAQASWLQQYSNLSITVEGHADERGTREYNLALGERRANATKNYLVALGVSPSRVNTISYGKERPAESGSDESAWSRNRRAVTDIQ